MRSPAEMSGFFYVLFLLVFTCLFRLLMFVRQLFTSVFTFKTKMSFSKEALTWAEQNLIGKSVFHPELKKKIHFTRQGIKHAVSSKSNRIKAEFIYSVISYLQTSKLIDINPDKKGRPDIKAVYTFFCEWNFENETYLVRMYVREGANGNIYYDHSVIKKKNLD